MARRFRRNVLRPAELLRRSVRPASEGALLPKPPAGCGGRRSLGVLRGVRTGSPAVFPSAPSLSDSRCSLRDGVRLPVRDHGKSSRSHPGSSLPDQAQGHALSRVQRILLGLSLRLGHPQWDHQGADAADHHHALRLRGVPSCASRRRHGTAAHRCRATWRVGPDRGVDRPPCPCGHQGLQDIGGCEHLLVHPLRWRGGRQRGSVSGIPADKRGEGIYSRRLLGDRGAEPQFRFGRSESRRLMALRRGWGSRFHRSFPHMFRHEGTRQDPLVDGPPTMSGRSF